MSRPTLVLLPGLLNTRRLFEHQIAALSDICDIIVPELHHYDTLGAMAEAALEAAPPRFAHSALLTGSEGKLSKRLGSLGVDHFREAGVEPIALGPKEGLALLNGTHLMASIGALAANTHTRASSGSVSKLTSGMPSSVIRHAPGAPVPAEIYPASGWPT